MVELRGKTVLLTGASTGLGPYIARRLHRAGAKFVLSARSEEALNALAGELGHSRIIVADLSRPGEPERLAQEAGPVDVLVSNAGIPATGRLTTFKIEQIDRAIAVIFGPESSWPRSCCRGCSNASPATWFSCLPSQASCRLAVNRCTTRPSSAYVD